MKKDIKKQDLSIGDEILLSYNGDGFYGEVIKIGVISFDVVIDIKKSNYDFFNLSDYLKRNSPYLSIYFGSILSHCCQVLPKKRGKRKRIIA